MSDQFYFTDEFQDGILAALIRHPGKFANLHTLLKPQYFWGVNSTKFCEILLDYNAKYGHFPAFQTLEQIIREYYGRENEDLAKECVGYAKKIAKVNTRDVDYIRDRFVFFCRERALIKSIEDSAAMIRSGKWPDNGFAPMFDQAMRVGQNLSEIGLRLYEDADAIIDKLTAVDYGVKTGYPLLDEIWFNGWGKGWLVSILAPPKSYKSTFSVNLALNMTSSALNKNAVNVHYYACEISAELTLARAYCRVAKQPMKTMYRDTELFRAAMHKGLEKRWKTGGKLLAKTFPSKAATIADIRAHTLSAIEAYQWVPRVIFIDHAETIRAPKTGKDMSDWRAQAEVYTQARALADELGCTVVMPDRCNKTTVNKATPDLTSFQGSFEKAGILDVAIGICQTDLERVKNDIRYIVFENRHGRQYDYFRGKVNQEYMTMTIDHRLDFEMERKQAEAEEKQQWRDRGPRGRALPKELEDV
jgi:KaiC/GvpD/RAD55 family RecA-like ATPase